MYVYITYSSLLPLDATQKKAVEINADANMAIAIGTGLALPASPTTNEASAPRANCRAPRTAEPVPALTFTSETASAQALPITHPIDATEPNSIMRNSHADTP